MALDLTIFRKLSNLKWS